MKLGLLIAVGVHRLYSVSIPTRSEMYTPRDYHQILWSHKKSNINQKIKK